MLANNLRIKDPLIVPSSLNFEECNENLYVFADYVKPSNTIELLSMGE
jgi:hypothetical protein